MATTTNRYGQIYHGEHHHINIRFPSTEARANFQTEFEAYHASHDHEGDIPTFKCVGSKDIKSYERGPQDLVKSETDSDYRITIDGYSWNEIHDYHNPTGWNDYFHYHVPTCCVPPMIVIGREFVDSNTLNRHELSAIFGDMPDTDLQSLLESVQAGGFIDPIVRIHEGQILDGWHRYRAARELNLLRKLRFQEWDENDRKDGDPRTFVLARNINRRHLEPGQRAQIAVKFNTLYGHGGDRSKETRVHLKTQAELAEEVNVSPKTIQRAKQVEDAGEAEAVISGEKTAGEVLKAQKQARLAEQRDLAEQSFEKMQTALESLAPDWAKSDFAAAACDRHNWGVTEFPDLQETDIPAIWESRFDLLRTEIGMPATWIQEMLTPMDTQTHEDTRETLKARETSKALKRKKHVLKNIWDARVNAAKNYTGDGDTELNQLFTLPELHKAFAKAHQYLADDFKSGINRIDTAVSFNHFQERCLAVDAYGNATVDTQDLEKEYRAITTYAHDLLAWDRQDWIQQLIQEKKSDGRDADDGDRPQAGTGSTTEPVEDAAETLKTLREQVKAYMPKWKQRYQESGYRENEIVSRASFSQLISSLRVYREAEQDGAATVEELKDLLDLMKRQSYPFAHQLRKSLRETGAAAPETPHVEQTDAETQASDADTSLDALNLPTLKGILDTLLDTVGTLEPQTQRDDLSAAVFDVLVAQHDGLTEREQLSVLFECADAIVSESL